MAIEKVLCLQGRYQDLTKLTIDDETVYGANAPDRRQDAARYLFGAKMDENQVLDYISSILNPTPLSTISWTFDSKGDGAYRFFYIDVPFYDNAATYVKEVVNGSGAVTQYADIVYLSGVLYQAIGTSFSGITPGVTSGWETSWVVILEEALKTQYLSDKITTFIDDDIATGEYEECILEMVENECDEMLCGACENQEKFTKLLRAQFMLEGALSYDWQDKATRSEVILKEAKKKYCC